MLIVPETGVSCDAASTPGAGAEWPSGTGEVTGPTALADAPVERAALTMALEVSAIVSPGAHRSSASPHVPRFGHDRAADAHGSSRSQLWSSGEKWKTMPPFAIIGIRSFASSCDIAGHPSLRPARVDVT